MATGGRSDNNSQEGLDLTEIESELAALDESSELDDTKESLVWEEHKAQEEYERIEAETSGEFDFSGFHTPNTSPTRFSSRTYLAAFQSESNLTRSAPTSPTASHVYPSSKSATTSPQSAQSCSTVKRRIKSFENLAKLQAKRTNLPVPKSKAESKTSTKPKSNTRLALKKGLGSPLAAAGNFYRKRKQKSKAKKVLSEKIITMAQVDISGAGRLNPRNRRAGGVGDTLENLGFPKINLENVPPAGRNVLRRFKPLRKEIVADANLVLTEANVIVGKTVVEGYLSEVVECREKFDKVLECVDQDIPNAEAAINEIIKIERELKNLLKYCEIQIVNRPFPHGAAAGGDQVKLARLDFPGFDGSGNYNTWKTNFNALAVHVRDDQTKKVHLLKALQGNAKSYISSTMVPTSTFNDLMEMLESRFNDPMAVNYNLLNRIFNSPELAKPQSTQAHWDSAVGDIKAIQESGLGIGEVLVFYRLHKFQNDIVRRVKDLHKIKYPGKASINLDEAIDIMNRLTAEEANLTEDTVSVEQCLQNLTLTATPKFSQYTKPTPPVQSYSTHAPQASKGNFNRPNKESGGRLGYTQNHYTPAQQFCQVCEGDDHNVGQCPNFTTPAERRAELARIGKCQSCGFKNSSYHRCYSNLQCKYCHGNHRNWLCIKKGPENIKNI